MPVPLAAQPQRQPPPSSQPRPSSSSGIPPPPFISPYVPSESTSSRQGHRRSQSANIPPPNRDVRLPAPSPYHPRHGPGSMIRRSTSNGVPIQISVESPSDPGNTPSPQPAEERHNSREHLSPMNVPTTLPLRTSSSSSSAVIPSPTSTPRSASNPLPQAARSQPRGPTSTHLYGPPPDANSYYQRQPPPVVPSTGTRGQAPQHRAPPPVVPSSSGSSSRPQRYPPRVHESQSPEDTRPPQSATARMYAAPTRSASMGAAPPVNTRPIIVPPPGSGRSPRLANGPLPGQPAIYQAEQGAQAQPAAYRGQPPVPIPPRHGSPAPLMVPSPEVRGAPLYVPSPEHRAAALGSSYAGSMPRTATNGYSYDQSQGQGYIPRSPSGSVSGLPPPSPRGPHANPLFTRFDRNSMENMGDMSQVALATATEAPQQETATSALTRGLKNVFGGRGRRK
ncbi:hypothetical protein PENSPDRAFT_663956 [Peniophora sp. CONT]|nr:hypothetical protein PENSPDRAFT_663956 [Peniophora sp. CONT]